MSHLLHRKIFISRGGARTGDKKSPSPKTSKGQRPNREHRARTLMINNNNNNNNSMMTSNNNSSNNSNSSNNNNNSNNVTRAREREIHPPSEGGNNNGNNQDNKRLRFRKSPEITSRNLASSEDGAAAVAAAAAAAADVHSKSAAGVSSTLSSARECSTSRSSGYSRRRSKFNRRVTTSRLLFWLFLLLVAVFFAVMAFWLLKTAETTLAEEQFHAIADRALNQSLEITLRQHMGLVTMATMVAETFPDANQWPNIYMNGFRIISQNLQQTSLGEGVAMAVMVKPEQKASFEAFVNQTYEPIARDLARWQIQGLYTNGTLYNETDDASTYWGSPYRVFVPFLYHSWFDNMFYNNYHSHPSRGALVDDIITCTAHRAKDIQLNDKNGTLNAKTEGAVMFGNHWPDPHAYVPPECSTITELTDLRTREPIVEPAAIAHQPIFPARNVSVLSGIMTSSVKWVEILKSVFSSQVSGVDCVITSINAKTSSTHNVNYYNVNRTKSFTFRVVGGVALLK